MAEIPKSAIIDMIEALRWLGLWTNDVADLRLQIKWPSVVWAGIHAAKHLSTKRAPGNCVVCEKPTAISIGGSCAECGAFARYGKPHGEVKEKLEIAVKALEKIPEVQHTVYMMAPEEMRPAELSIYRALTFCKCTARKALARIKEDECE